MSKPWMFLRRFCSCPLAVAELGAGTGVITQAIDQNRQPASRFLSFERDDSMRTALAGRYPSVTFQDDAFRLRSALREQQLNGLDCVISGLPLFNFPDRDRRSLLMDIRQSLNPGGVFVAFQYTRQIRPFLVSIYDDLETWFVWANFPPAFVYLCKKPA